MEALGGSRGGDGWQPPPGIKLESLPLEDLARLVVTNIVPSSVYGREAFAIELGMALLEGGEAAMRKAEVVTERHAPRQLLQLTMRRTLVATGLVAADDPRLHNLSAEQVCAFGWLVPLHRSIVPRTHANIQKRHTRGGVPTCAVLEVLNRLAPAARSQPVGLQMQCNAMHSPRDHRPP